MAQRNALRPSLNKLETYLKAARPVHDVLPIQQVVDAPQVTPAAKLTTSTDGSRYLRSESYRSF
jgi:hypothetical protein